MAIPLTSAAAHNKQTQKLRADLQALEAEKLPFITDLKLDFVDDLHELTGVMIGPQETPYAGGHFRFVAKFPAEYPFKPPAFGFVTKVCHPNIHSTDGTACHDELIGKWSPRVKLIQLLTEMQSLLSKPNYEKPIADDPMTVKNPEIARQWTEQHARPAS